MLLDTACLAYDYLSDSCFILYIYIDTHTNPTELRRMDESLSARVPLKLPDEG